MALSRVPSHQFTVDSNITIPTGKKLNAVDIAGVYAPGHVVQVVQSVKSDTFSTTVGQGNPTAITGLTGSITPKFATSKILVQVNIGQISGNSDTTWAVWLFRDSTKIAYGDASGSRSQSVIAGGVPSTGGTWRGHPAYINYLDSPATTASITYSVRIGGNSGSIVYVNRDGRFTDAGNDSAVTVSTVVLTEIAQ